MGKQNKKRKLNEAGDSTAVSTIPSNTTSSNGAQKPQDPRTLFVSALPPTTTSSDLAAHFSQAYPLKHAVAVLDKVTTQCRGYGFVTYTDIADATAAKTELDGSVLLGKKIKVDSAQVRKRQDEHGAKIVKGADGKKEVSVPKLIVRNLPWSVDSKEKLAHMFLSFGKVKEAVLPRGEGGKLLGFGIVIVRGKKNAEKAVADMNGKMVDGRTLAVDWAADRETWEKAKAEEEGDKDEEVGNGEEAEDEPEEENDWEDDSEGDEDEDDSQDAPKKRYDNTDCTVFVRNLPFTCGDDELTEHFEQFGNVRYSRVVYNQVTEQSRGTGFVCFMDKTSADTCTREAPKSDSSMAGAKNGATSHTVLQDEASDPSGKYTLQGRVLIVTKAVKKDEAERLRDEGVEKRSARDRDKRRLYLLHEGRITSKSPLYSKLSPSDIAMREASAKQRKKFVETNPSLHLSLTRLSVRNLPRSMNSKDLKALARKAIVGFAEDVTNEKRKKLSKEETARGGEEMKLAERERRLKGKGVVRQAKVVVESKEGTKIQESEGGGRSRGYGFIEYYTHRNALMGLRWLNGHQVDYKAASTGKKGAVVDEDRKRRLIVEFALENVNVVTRRAERIQKMPRGSRQDDGDAEDGGRQDAGRRGMKRKRSEPSRAGGESANGRQGAKFKQGEKPNNRDKSKKGDAAPMDGKSLEERNNLAKRSRIIAKKRMARKARK
ncbi:putative ribosome biogenesis [Microthyrium microscopicum]|uniref:Putative ribosome biogenesis n=1 Tax=Microthyrium microscopicum TaxID=703497 RepID=A0A6A6UJZ6_9PEZI|nr:putative ribosome biogenesis [Microthyrium microscopicum]